jgi:hypothetical protein
VKANILNFECFSDDWTRDGVIDRIFTNKKFTVAILEMFIDIFGLDKVYLIIIIIILIIILILMYR